MKRNTIIWGLSAVILFSTTIARHSNAMDGSRIFLETEREVYFPEEEINMGIWYIHDKTYPSPEYCCIELLSASGQVVLQKTLVLQGDRAETSMQVPGVLASGFYYLRAYTPLEKDKGEDRFAIRKIMIINPVISPEFRFPLRKSYPAGQVKAHFFPEGGKIIRGLPAVVYVHFEGLADKGYEGAWLQTASGDSIALAEPLGPSIACFKWLPENRDYYLVLPSYYPHISIPLPEAAETGTILRFWEEREGLRFRLTKNDSLQSFGDLKVVGYRFDDTEYKMSFSIDAGPDMYRALEPGVYKILFEGKNEEVLASYWYEKKSTRGFFIEARGIEKSYQPGDTIRMKLHTELSTGEGSYAGIKVEVLRKIPDFFDQPSFQDFINSPSSFPYLSEFTVGGEERDRALWTLFGEKICEPEMIHAKTCRNEFMVEGRFHDSERADALMFLSFPEDRSQLFTARTDSSGFFSFPSLPVHGERDVMVKTVDSLDTGYISLRNPFYPGTEKNLYFPSAIDSAEELTLNELYTLWALQKGYGGIQWGVSEAKNEAFRFFEDYDFHILLENFVDLPNMEEIFFEIVRPVLFVKENKKTELRVVDRISNRSLGGNPLFMVNGIPFDDPQIILDLDASRVKDLGVIARRYFMGGEIFDGVIVINTHNGKLAGKDIQSVHLLDKIYFPEENKNEELRTQALNRYQPYMPASIYRNPQVRFTGRDSGEFWWIAPDLPGEYEIRIKGKIRDKAVFASQRIFFRVEEF